MTVTFLPDVNLLIALIDPSHVGHEAAHRWFADTGSEAWATCPNAAIAGEVITLLHDVYG